uniref:tetratricopeptide repeat protein n=2 Tax=Methylibium sp. T29 TaxID=1430884 RepID=UPI00049A9BEF|nr:tetratricopeptide repeat protein [Methylibium sp. T29]AIA99093.1 Polar organelle development protein [Methylibium sp. T29]
MDESERDSLEAAFQVAFEQQQNATSEAEHSAALTEFKRLAGLGHAAASANAGYMLANGIGAQTDYEDARRWLSLGAEQGDATAINNLAVMFLRGSGIEADASKACELFEVAAHKGHVGAQLSLGELFESGEFLTVDLEQAKHWFEAAAQQGDPTGMFRLGRLLLLAGAGSQSEGIKWLEAAAETGNPEWQYLLAVQLEGEPELRGEFGARHWYERAAEQGHSAATVRLAAYEGRGAEAFWRLALEPAPIVQALGDGGMHVLVSLEADLQDRVLSARFGPLDGETETFDLPFEGGGSFTHWIEEGFAKISQSRGHSDQPQYQQGDQVTLDYSLVEERGRSAMAISRLTYEVGTPSKAGLPWGLAGDLEDYVYRGSPTLVEALLEAKIRTIKRLNLDAAEESAYCELLSKDVNQSLRF